MAAGTENKSKAPDCIFCLIIKGTIPAMKVYEDEHVVSFLDIYPTNKGHTLVVPKRHFRDLASIPPEDYHHAMDAVQRLAPQVKTAMGADGVNVGINTEAAAGQSIFHFHVHIIPRWADDGLRMWPNKSYGKNEIVEIQERIAKTTGYSG